ncbi:YidB family protein [Phenylobacterium hankyongense]|uniref:YidB family protein n=1 Tax=Phenylobacterium hankyongense TaxID=1813876 RepID=UPI001A9D95CB|nr:YidB family protein [Phenylobacterium hankyongense]
MIVAGLLLALAVKAARHYAPQPGQGAGEGRSFDPQRQPAQPAQTGGGLGGMGGAGLGGALGGLLGGGGLGNILGGLGGAGALGALISQFQQKGYGQQVNSWVGSGQNQPIAPNQLEDALGDDTVRQLEQQTGMPRQALLSDLSRTLPEAVHELTPASRVPTDDELQQIAGQAAAGH